MKFIMNPKETIDYFHSIMNKSKKEIQKEMEKLENEKGNDLTEEGIRKIEERMFLCQKLIEEQEIVKPILEEVTPKYMRDPTCLRLR